MNNDRDVGRAEADDFDGSVDLSGEASSSYPLHRGLMSVHSLIDNLKRFFLSVLLPYYALWVDCHHTEVYDLEVMFYMLC